MTRTRLRCDRLDDRLVPTTLPAGFAEAVVAAGLTEPTAMAQTLDGRLLVTEQEGAVRVIRNDALLPTAAVTLTVDPAGERGLLGVAVDPAFSTNGFVYLYHTVPAAGGTPAFNRVSRFTMSGDVIDPASRVTLVDLDPLTSATNHNGGALAFGGDGKLYVGVGENATVANSQRLDTRHGKILRYNPDGTIPADNPTAFAGVAGTTAGANRAIWAVGLRNPFTLAPQPGTGRVFVNDVGAASFEEVNSVAAGVNGGWPATEGDFDPAAFPAFTRPAVTYPHGSGNESGFSIAGAAFYAPANPSFPAEYAGDYFFGDFVNDWVRRLDPATGVVTAFASDLPGGLVDIDVTPTGELLYVTRSTGTVYRVRSTQAPAITTQPAAATTTEGDAVTFRVVASGPGPITYQWQRNGADIAGATTDTFTLDDPQPGDSGARFRVVVRNGNGSVTSSDAVLTVTPDAFVPQAVAIGASSARLIDPATGRAALSPDLRSVPGLPPFPANVRVAAIDLNGDEVADLIAGAGPGGPPAVAAFDGKTGGVLASGLMFEASFTGGVYVAAGDVTGDGVPEIVVTPDEGGGPRVRVLAADLRMVVADFFGIDDANFRGGARAAVGDINADGTGDVIVAAGFGGGPRVAGFDGTTLAGARRKLFGDFFAFEQTLRNGVFIAAGDLDADGKAEVIAGGGPGGGPRVFALGGAALLDNRYEPRANFFAGDTADRGGARVAAKDLDGDARADLLVGVGSRATGYAGSAVGPAGTPPTGFTFDADAAVYVG